MSKQHTVFMSATNYPDQLRIFECQECSYAFAAKVNGQNIMQYDTKVTFNYGDLEATHTIMQIPDDQLRFKMSAGAPDQGE